MVTLCSEKSADINAISTRAKNTKEIKKESGLTKWTLFTVLTGKQREGEFDST